MVFPHCEAVVESGYVYQERLEVAVFVLCSFLFTSVLEEFISGFIIILEILRQF